jgi:hypothetical protein
LLRLECEHGWSDFVRSYRGRERTNVEAHLVDASSYAVGRAVIHEEVVRVYMACLLDSMTGFKFELNEKKNFF